MTSRRINDPLAGERLQQVVPEPGGHDQTGFRRLHLFSGRALSDGALTSEQDHRRGRLRQLAQLRSPGVVRGLEVAEEQPATTQQWLQISPGYGLTAFGAEVGVPRPLRLPFASLRRLDGTDTPATPTGTPASPRLWILLLQPVSVLQAVAVDPNRCSEWDESGRAFEEETHSEGVRFGVLPVDDRLPEEWATQQQRQLLGHGEERPQLAWSPDGSQLASAGSDGILRMWTGLEGAAGQTSVERKGHQGGVTSLSWRPDGWRLASGGAEGQVRLWSPGDDRPDPLAEAQAHERAVLGLEWHPDGQRLASGAEDGSLKLWRAERDGELSWLTDLGRQDGAVTCLSWSPDGQTLASGGTAGVVLLWVASGDGWAIRAKLQAHDGAVRCLAWSGDGGRLTSGGEDGVVRIWVGGAGEDLQLLVEQRGHRSDVLHLAWNSDDTALASGGADGSVRLWSMDSPQEPPGQAVTMEGAVLQLRWDVAGLRVASADPGEKGIRLGRLEPKRWRNLIADALLQWEQRERANGQPMPWDRLGLPIALIALSADRQRIAFVDSAVVVRTGGALREGTPLLPQRPPIDLIRARLQQFAEQMAELPAAGALPWDQEQRWFAEQVVAPFRHLPPVGLLPRAALGDLQLHPRSSVGWPQTGATGLTTRECRFFPATWLVHLTPIPQEQLELALGEACALAPYDLDQPDQVQLWVPVPEAWFEPDLLLSERADQAFQDAIELSKASRNDWLQRRGWLRRRLGAITRAISGTAVSFATPDPGQLDADEVEPDAAPDAEDPQAQVSTATVAAAGSAAVAEPEDHYGTERSGTNRIRKVTALDKLVEELRKTAPIDNDAVFLPTKKDDQTQQRRDLTADQIAAIQSKLALINTPGAEQLTYDGSSGLLTIRGVMSDAVKTKLIARTNTGTNPASNSVFDPLLFDQNELETAINRLFESSKDNTALLGLDQMLIASAASTSPPSAASFIGLEAFIERLQQTTARADDSIEFGFLQARTNMFRIRQQVMGQEDAVKLATSPTLAAIATRETARVSQDDLKNYFQRIKSVSGSERSLLRLSIENAEDPTSGTQAADSLAGEAAETREAPQPAAQPTIGPAPRRFAAMGFPVVGLTNQPLLFNQDPELAIAAAGPALDAENVVQDSPWLINAGIQVASATVIGDSPLTGSVPELISVAQRLPQPAAVQTSDFVISDRLTILAGLSNQGLFKDLAIPGQPELTFGAVQTGGAVLDPQRPAAGADEVGYFSKAVETLDLTVAALRLGEGRVQQVRQAIGLCLRTLQELRQLQDRLEQRLRLVEIALAEARQDLSVAQALLAEEEERVKAINDRRSRILREHVAFLAFQRPRSLDLRRPSAWIRLDPAAAASPVPPCFNDTTPIPREVRAMVELLREAPLGWFSGLLAGLRRLDRIDTLVRLYRSAAQRREQIAAASLTVPQLGAPSLTAVTNQELSASELGNSPIGRSIGRLYGQRQLLLRQRWLRQPPPTLELVAAQSWQESLRQAELCLTLGDLLAGDHHRPELSAEAAALQEQWCRVATCLKERFGAVQPRFRLDWAERLSQFDGPADLRQLSSLPRWGEVADGPDRRALQELVDWLFQQVNGEVEEAVAFANDLVRLALLLACHAPVNQILSGQVITPGPLAPEARLPVRIDPLRVRIGMPVLFHGSDGVVAEGVVEDLSGTVATTRILRGNASRSADTKTRVQFLRQPLH
jgi:Tol biopolymer transport system component